MAILRQNLFRSRQLMDWRLRLSDKTVRKFAELPIYCQRQKCSPRNVVSGSIRFMQIFAGFAGERASIESCVVENGDFGYLWPHTLGHVTRRMRIAPKTLYNGEVHQLTTLSCHRSPLKVCKVNRQYGVRDSKYVVICDPPTLGHVTRRLRIAPKTLYGEADQLTTLNCHRSPLKVAKWIGNMGLWIPNMSLFVTPLPSVT